LTIAVLVWVFEVINSDNLDVDFWEEVIHLRNEVSIHLKLNGWSYR